MSLKNARMFSLRDKLDAQQEEFETMAEEEAARKKKVGKLKEQDNKDE